MALKAANQVKVFSATGQSLEADADESFRIKKVYAFGGATAGFLTMVIAGTVLAKFRTAGKGGNHLPFVAGDNAYPFRHPLLLHLQQGGWPIEWPVATGETLTLTWDTGAVDAWACVVYDIYDSGEQKADMPNGSRSLIRRYVHYGLNTLATAGQVLEPIDNSEIWSGGPAWPFDKSGVDQGHIFRIKGIVGMPFAKDDGAAGHLDNSKYLKLTRRGTVLFDEDRNGLPFRGDPALATSTSLVQYLEGGSVLGPLTEQHPHLPLIFPEPLLFTEGDTLLSEVEVESDWTNFSVGDAEIAYLIEHELAAR